MPKLNKIKVEVGSSHITNNYGEIVVIRYDNAKRVLVKFRKTGYETLTHSDCIRNGLITDHQAKAENTKIRQDDIKTIKRTAYSKKLKDARKDIDVGTVHNTLTCGLVEVVEYTNTNHIKVKFINTGYVSKTTAKTLRGDTVRIIDPLAHTVFSIGCIGIGPHLAHIKGKDTKPYQTWRAILRRCYVRTKENASRRRCYDGCTVHSSWLNYQVFAEWYACNYPDNGNKYQIDKDIKIPGNKEYGPDACMFVTQLDNLGARKMTA